MPGTHRTSTSPTSSTTLSPAFSETLTQGPTPRAGVDLEARMSAEALDVSMPARDALGAYRAFLDEHWDPDLTLGAWWERVVDHGWGAPPWPTKWHGRGLPSDTARLLADERARRGIPGGPGGLGVLLAGPTILAHGTDAHKQRFLR